MCLMVLADGGTAARGAMTVLSLSHCYCANGCDLNAVTIVLAAARLQSLCGYGRRQFF